MIESEVLPRLYLAHKQARPAPQPRAEGTARLPDEAVGEFAELALTASADRLLEAVEALLSRGLSQETVLTDLLAPVARLLGTWWEEDRCTFTDVTLGLSRLHSVVQGLARQSEAAAPVAQVCHSAYLAATPGEQHVFGLTILGAAFRAAGWDTDSDPLAARDQVLSGLARHPHDVAAFTLSQDHLLGTLSDLIGATRRASANPKILILVGGRLFTERASLCSDIGADATAPTAAEAVSLAGRLVNSIETGRARHV